MFRLCANGGREGETEESPGFSMEDVRTSAFCSTEGLGPRIASLLCVSQPEKRPTLGSSLAGTEHRVLL